VNCTLLLIIGLLIVFNNQATENANVNRESVWRSNFQSFTQCKDNLLDQGFLEYDLELRLWPDNRPNVINNIPSLLCHGFGASATTMTEYARVNSPDRIPGDVFTFCFKDKPNNSGTFVFHSSFGQAGDVKSCLMALRVVYECCYINSNNISIIGCNLFGQSRGAGTIVNVLSVLNTDTNYWDFALDDIKQLFDQDMRNNILCMIKKGVVVLDAPMVSVKAGFDAHVHEIFRGLFFEKIISCIGHDYILPLITWGKYSPSGMQALTSVDNLPKGLKVLVSYQKNDAAVGNLYDKVFAEKLIKQLSHKNVWVILASDGDKNFNKETWKILQQADQEGKIHRRWFIGLPYCAIPAHNAGFITLLCSGILNAFFKKHNGSYFNNKKQLDCADNILNEVQKELESSAENYFVQKHYIEYGGKSMPVVQPNYTLLLLCVIGLISTGLASFKFILLFA